MLLPTPRGRLLAELVCSGARRLPCAPVRPGPAARRRLGPKSLGCPLAARGPPSGVGCRRSEESDRRLSAVLRPEGLGSTAPYRPPRGEPVRDRALRGRCLPPEGGGPLRRAAAVSRLPRESAASRRRPAPEGAFGWRVAEVAPRSRLPPPCVRLPEGGRVQRGWGPPLPPPKSGVLLSLRPIGSSEEDPAFRPNAASVQSVATRAALPEGGASPARGLFPFAASVVRRRLPVAWWSVLARGLASPKGGSTAFQS